MRALTVMQCELQGKYKTQPEDVGRAVNHLGSSLAFFHEELAAEVHQDLYEACNACGNGPNQKSPVDHAVLLSEVSLNMTVNVI